MAQAALNLDALSPEEQLQLLEDLWERLCRHPGGPPLTDEQKAELDRRLDDMEDDIRNGRPLGRPWSEVKERLQSR